MRRHFYLILLIIMFNISREARLNLQRMNGDAVYTGMRIGNEVKLLISC